MVGKLELMVILESYIMHYISKEQVALLLTKKEIFNKKTEMKVNFEKVADDLLMVSVLNQIENHGIPSYWRLTKTIDIPPLEIGIDFEHGFVSCITFFIDGLAISEIEDLNKSFIEGNIIVDTSIFTKDNDYHDVNLSYDINVCDSKVICSFVSISNNVIVYRNDRIEIYVDSTNCIVGFSICDLTEDEKYLIKSIRFNQ